MSNRPKTLQVGAEAALPVRPSVRFLYPCIRKNLVGHFNRTSSIETGKVAPRVQTRVSKSSLMVALHSRIDFRPSRRPHAHVVEHRFTLRDARFRERIGLRL